MAIHIRRREFIFTLGGAAARGRSRRARSSRAMPVIGFIGSTSPVRMQIVYGVFRQGLNETGFVEGRNVAIEFRWAESEFDRMPALIADLVRQQVAVIAMAGSTSGAVAAKVATTTIPIVFSLPGTRSTWPCCQPESTGRQSHRHDCLECRTRAEAAGAAA